MWKRERDTLNIRGVAILSTSVGGPPPAAFTQVGAGGLGPRAAYILPAREGAWLGLVSAQAFPIIIPQSQARPEPTTRHTDSNPTYAALCLFCSFSSDPRACRVLLLMVLLILVS